MLRANENRVVVIGGNDAGLSAAGRIKRTRPDLEVLVLEATPHLSYASCGLPLYISGRLRGSDISSQSAEEIEKSRGFRVKTRNIVHDIDTVHRRVLSTDSADGRESDLKYSRLIMATGASPVIPDPLPVDADNLFCMRNFEHAQRLDHYITRQGARRALVVGAGPLGLEMSDALVSRGLGVILIERSKLDICGFSEPITALIKKALIKRGIDFRPGCEIEGLQRHETRISGVSLKPGSVSVPVDLVFAAAGIRPRTELAEKAGIPLGRSGAIAVNRRQMSGRLDVYAAGDCAESFHAILGRPEWFPFAGLASKAGRIAGSNAAGRNATSAGALGSMMIKAFGLEIGRTGLTLAQARANKIDAIETTITQHARAVYAEGNSPVTITLISERRHGRLLGAQICGQRDAGIRLNLLAMALSAKMRPGELASVDMGYAPEIVHMWDPVQIAGRAAEKENVRSR